MKENNKFVVGEDETTKSTENISASPSTITTTTASTQYKRPVRHHVKRRSSGRVHVAKLAPMARANSSNHTDTEADYSDEPNTTTEHNRPTMKRSQSQRSLHKMSFDRKGFGSLTAARRKSTASSTDKISISEIIPTPKDNNNQVGAIKTLSNNPASLSSSNIAAPVEITFNAVANNMVIPKKELMPTIASPLKSSAANNSATTNSTIVNNSSDTQQQHGNKKLLRSQFVTSSYEESIVAMASYKCPTAIATTSMVSIPFNQTRSNSSSTSNNPSNMSRTQQKLLLQKQQALVEDENSPVHPRNMHKLNKEFDMVGREYKCIKRYEDPMRVSLMRCMDKLDSHEETATSVNPQLARLQLDANHHSMSTSIVPTISHVVANTSSVNNASTVTTTIPHLKQREIAHHHHHLKSIALTRTNDFHKRQLQQSISPNASNSNSNNNNSKQTSNSNVFAAFPWNAAAFIDRIFSSTPH
ncbi:hypothetical protein INT46_009310 [Mucor plumbeus]|uniref:Uncharacterized protein n=1 Tax=Mucor plumbeus TaxID=97098 RepID=A0A8H7QIG3_9FUNG|nr:hypothetical protein INT46_009310 [Mucor plumbeus]